MSEPRKRYILQLAGRSIVFLLCCGLCVFASEWFWEKSNAAPKYAACTDKLCTQYCQKLRK